MSLRSDVRQPAGAASSAIAVTSCGSPSDGQDMVDEVDAVDLPRVPSLRGPFHSCFRRADSRSVPVSNNSSTAREPHPCTRGSLRRLSRLKNGFPMVEGIHEFADHEPNESDLNRERGANPRYTTLLVREYRRYKELTSQQGLTNAERDWKLQEWSSDATKAEVGIIMPVYERLKTAGKRPPDPLLGVVRLVPPPPTKGVPAAEFLYAFGAAAAPHAGSSLSWTWLSQYIGRDVAKGAVVHKCLNVGLSCAIIQWGSTMYVGIAVQSWDTWDSLLKFFSFPLVTVNEQELLDCIPSTSTGFPNTAEGSEITEQVDVPEKLVAVNSAAWAACKDLRGVLDAVREALAPRATNGMGSESAAASSDRTASRVVFCGHGAAAAVSTLLALQYKKHLSGSALPPGPPSVVTFGCPLFGNAALQSVIRRELPDATRYYVDHDPVAGLPRWSAVGLRFCAAAQNMAPHAVRKHRELSIDGVPRIGVSGVPRVASLAVAGVAYGSHHRLEAYALCLTRLWANMSESSNLSQRKRMSVPWLRRHFHRVPQLIKNSRTEEAATTSPREES